MFSKTVTVGAPTSHLRPATVISTAAAHFHEGVTVSLLGEEDEGVDASSSLMLMTLGAEAGSSVVVSSSDVEAVETIAELVAQSHDDTAHHDSRDRRRYS